MASAPIGTCPICLTDIAAEDEAFLDVCLHHFCSQCIQAWSAAQRTNGGAPTALLLCPVCRRPYHSVIFDCRGVDFRQLRVTDATGSSNENAGLRLTPGHRRRRSVYLGASDVSPGGHDLAGSRVLLPPLIQRPAVRQWMLRELQAVLLQEDVELVVRHVLGTLEHAAKRRTPAANSLQAGVSVAAAAEAITAAAQPYLGEAHALRFAHESVAFVASGLTVVAHDAVAFKLEPGQATATGAEGVAGAQAAPASVSRASEDDPNTGSHAPYGDEGSDSEGYMDLARELVAQAQRRQAGDGGQQGDGPAGSDSEGAVPSQEAFR